MLVPFSMPFTTDSGLYLIVKLRQKKEPEWLSGLQMSLNCRHVTGSFSSVKPFREASKVKHVRE